MVKINSDNLKLCFNQLLGVWNTRNLSGIFHVGVLTIFGGAKNSDIVLITFICTSIIIVNESDPRSNVHDSGSSENKA